MHYEAISAGNGDFGDEEVGTGARDVHDQSLIAVKNLTDRKCINRQTRITSRILTNEIK